MIYFRFHRSSLKEALETEKKFNNIKELFKYLDMTNSIKYTIKYYCFDERNNIGDTFIIISHRYNAPIGFLYLKNGG